MTKQTDRYLKMKATMIKKYGSEEAWKKHMAENGRKGGQNAKNNKFFRDVPGLARKAALKSIEVRRKNAVDKHLTLNNR